MNNMPIMIDDIIVSGEILDEYFACDYEKCAGACCIIGDSGAPMEEDEPQLIEENYHLITPFMRREGIAKIEEEGFFTIDSDSDCVTPLLGNSEECAYCNFENNGACYCAIERSWCNGKSKFVKPISCRLYPIRVSHLSNGTTALNLHRWNICEEAFKKGKKENIKVYQFLKVPLIEAFGEEFYAALEYAAKAEATH